MVTIYSTPTCAFCHAAKQYLAGRDVEFKDIDVSRDMAAAKKMVDLTGQFGVPVIDIDGDVIIGFNRPHIDLALREKKLV